MAVTTKLTGAVAYGVLPVEDYDRAKDFYENKVGLAVKDVSDQPGMGMLQAGNGTQVLLYSRERTKAEHTALGFEVDDVVAAVADLKARGVVFEEYDLPGLKTEDGIARMGTSVSAWFTDTEGNIISINQM